MKIDSLSTERYDIGAYDISYEDLQVIAAYSGDPNIKFKPINSIRSAWQTQNFLYMASVQTHEVLMCMGASYD